MNNAGIYDAVLAGVAGSTQSLETGKSTAANFTAFGVAAQQLAVQVDNLIAPIVGGVQPNHIALMSSIVSGLEFNRYMKTGEFLPATMALSIVQLFNAIFPLLTTVPVTSNFEATLADGSSFFATGMIFSPGVTRVGDKAQFYLGKESAVPLQLNADGMTALLTQVLTGMFGISTRYTCTLEAKVSIWQVGAPAEVGSMSTAVDLHILTDGAGVATVTVQTAPFIDSSRLPVTMIHSSMTVTATPGGFIISVARETGVVCRASAAWWISKVTVVS